MEEKISMKKIFLIITFLVTLSFCTSVSVAEERQTHKIDVALHRLFQSHLKFISDWQTNASELDDFDKVFFADFNFLNASNTKNFFQNIEYNLQNGKAYPGLMQVSYSSFTSINGKVTGINYEYKSDGKNIILTKGTYNNGEMLRAVYNYNVDGKLLNTTEVKGNKLLNKKSYRLEI